MDEETKKLVREDLITFSVINLSATDFEFNMTTDKGYYLMRCKK